SDLASIGTLASSIAVFVSLIYVGLQMRQNAKHTRALIHQGRVARIVDFQLRCAEPSLSAAIVAGNGLEATQTTVREQQFHWFCLALFMSMEDTFDQNTEGLIGQKQFADLKRGLSGSISEPGLRAFFQSRVDDSPFGRYIGEIIAG